jgi:LCP family protein required for cell wall assembly
VPVVNEKTPVVNSAGTAVPVTSPLQPSGGPSATQWDGVSRVTVLVMGLDYRDWEAGNYPRTDSMILLTLDPLSKTAGMLSIPRDMWVNIPNYGYNKINTAYYLAEANRLPGGGPALAVATVESFIGVPINYYAQIDFGAFERIIDEIGGVQLEVKEEITIDPIGKNNTRVLGPGPHLLMGPEALAYARARYTEGGDFDRAARQQQVAMAILNRVFKVNMLPTLITKAPVLYQEVSAGVRTNLSLDQVVRLALLLQQIPADNIKRGIIGAGQVEFGKSASGLDILVPLSDKIRLVRDDVFTTGGPVGPSTVGADTAALVKGEAAKVTIRNASGTSGLLARTSEYFKAQGMVVVEEVNVNVVETSSLIIYGARPYTMGYLSKLMSIPPARIAPNYQDAPMDMVIILGRDWARKNPLP